MARVVVVVVLVHDGVLERYGGAGQRRRTTEYGQSVADPVVASATSQMPGSTGSCVAAARSASSWALISG